MTDPNETELAQEFQRCRTEIIRALAYTGGSHTIDDVWDLINKGDLQLWCGPHSVIVSEIQKYPQYQCLHFFLAAGRLDELEAMYPVVLEWGKQEHGVTRASLAGRPGWARSFLTKKNGWTASHLVLTKEI
jgi:hypothetical protein